MELQNLHHRFDSGRSLQVFLLQMGSFWCSLCTHFLPIRQGCRHSADETRGDCPGPAVTKEHGPDVYSSPRETVVVTQVLFAQKSPLGTIQSGRAA